MVNLMKPAPQVVFQLRSQLTSEKLHPTNSMKNALLSTPVSSLRRAKPCSYTDATLRRIGEGLDLANFLMTQIGVLQGKPL